MANLKDTFAEVYNDYYPLVFSTVYTKIGNADDASDIAQDVFIRLYDKMDTVRDYRKWLYGTLRNVVLEYFRSQKSETLHDEDFNDVGLTFVNGMKEQRIIIADVIKQIEEELCEDDLVLFDYVAVYNYSYSEAAKELGITKRKVQYRYNKIVSKILDYLKKQNIQSFEDLL